MHLDEFRLSIPAVSLKNWHDAVQAASGLMKDVLSVQTHGLELLRRVKESQASTERIGWLNMWSKVFAALQAVMAAINYQSKLVLLMAQRNTFELMLQAHTIVDPVRKLNDGSTKSSRPRDAQEYAFRSSIDRLRAYTAWCLWHDKAYFKEVLNPKSMRDIWDIEPGTLAGDAGKASFFTAQFLEKIGAPLDEKVLRTGSRNVRKYYTERIRQIDEWMADPKLAKWAAAVNQASRNNIVGVPFFILFDRADVSIPKRLLREGIRFTYSNYIMSSMASHGSSMEEYLKIQNNTITPFLSGDKEQIDILAPEVIVRCQHMFTILDILDNEMRNKPQIRS
jgi:hypothetical protein